MAKAKTVAKTPAKKTAANPAAAAAQTAPPKGAEDAYNQYLSAAQALSASAVLPFKGNANVVYANVQTAVASVLGQKAEITAQLPNEDTSVFTSLPSLALGLIFATLQQRADIAAVRLRQRFVVPRTVFATENHDRKAVPHEDQVHEGASRPSVAVPKRMNVDQPRMGDGCP
jgi:hypothetical protein